MTVNEELVDKLASLARLRFNKLEKEAIATDLEKMISFVQKMDEVDTSNVEPLQHMTSAKNVWRADEIGGTCTQKDALKNAGNHNDQFFLVPKVIKKIG
jgi:aspartyl-tRNA(Asn)/glutamyl-tRNA(Gln) amidotransferase subunit C